MSEDTINNNTLLQTEKLEVSPVRAKGYGVISKVAMLDPRLTIQAKGIYAYLCSYGGRGNGIYPGRDRILTDLGITKDTYYTHFNMLKKYGYITVTQIKMG
ncbi:MAG: helix-turn-helix domain-containing protein, partial [Oscillospiraceae bacterium]|nr:helix-turn-helix domain-containing protein [Oscillospiraceae bacterium]